MNPRLCALKVLLSLEQSPQRLEKILDSELQRHPQDQPRDKAFASKLVYGVLRHRLYLDHILAPHIKRGLKTLDPEVLGMLHLGAYELAVLGNKPYAVVNAVVSAAKRSRAKRAQGLINAVLRKVGVQKDQPTLPGLDSDALGHISIKYSHPAWLVEEMLTGWPLDFVAQWCAANQSEPPLSLRVNTLKTSSAELISLLNSLAETVGDHALCPDSLVLKGLAGPAGDLPGFRDGLWQMQDPGASALSLLLGLKPGMRVLDLCAGVGGKTGHLAALMQNQGELVAVEPSPGRFKALKDNLKRLGVRNTTCLQADGTKLPKDLGKFDRILLDAPCTALGVIRRRPDVRYRRDPSDPARLAELQYSLLDSAVQHLDNVGALLYCTCSITRHENQDVVRRILAARPELDLDWPDSLNPAQMACIENDGYFRTYPHLQDCDAFFAARLVKKQ